MRIWMLLAFASAGRGASVDLMTPRGLAAVQGQWRYHDAQIVETKFFRAGADGQPSPQPAPAYDLEPRAGAPDFDDSQWEILPAGSLAERRGGGKLSFNWYRLRFTVPPMVDHVSTAGATAWLDVSLDDYAEVWVDGELTRSPGQQGGSVIGGWNARNRLVVGRNVRPGQQIQVAIFGINGPLSQPPTNYIYFHHALLHFEPGPGGSAGPQALPLTESNIEVIRLHPGIDRIVPRNPKLFKLAEGFQFTEGPVWSRQEKALYFSDPNANTIYRLHEGQLRVFRQPSGYSGADVVEYKQPGSNGLTFDAQGRLTINEHGNHRVSRLTGDGKVEILADQFEGKRLNSPNDLVYRSDGALFFTDPPFGLPKFHADPRRELSFSGIYSLHKGQLRLLNQELQGPNGIAFSPDEKWLYVGNWDEKRKVVMRYPVREDATLGAGSVFFNMTQAPGEDAIDGIKVDERGNLYVSGPGGLWILDAQGNHLGTIRLPRHPHNFAWGGEDGQTLYLCARDSLYRLPLLIPGVRP